MLLGYLHGTLAVGFGGDNTDDDPDSGASARVTVET